MMAAERPGNNLRKNSAVLSKAPAATSRPRVSRADFSASADEIFSSFCGRDTRKHLLNSAAERQQINGVAGIRTPHRPRPQKQRLPSTAQPLLASNVLPLRLRAIPHAALVYRSHPRPPSPRTYPVESPSP